MKLTKPQERELANVAKGDVLARSGMALSRVQRLADGTVRHTYKSARPNRVAQILSRLQGMGLIEVNGEFYIITHAGLKALQEIATRSLATGEVGSGE